MAELTKEEILEKKRIYNNEYYHTKRKVNKDYVNIIRQKALERYHEKMKDPEFAEKERIRRRNAMRLKRLKKNYLQT